jgi:superfamily I DNA and/or RNA helicase
VHDPRRLNVTISRARKLFIGVGDAGTLGVSKPLQELIDRAANGGGYISGWELA